MHLDAVSQEVDELGFAPWIIFIASLYDLLFTMALRNFRLLTSNLELECRSL